MRELTQAQQAILDFIRTFTNGIGRAPTVAEIQTAFDYSSRTTVYSHLGRLESKGFLERRSTDELNRRSTLLTDKAKRLLHTREPSSGNIAYSRIGDLVTLPDTGQLLRELLPESGPDDFLYHVGTNKYAAEGLPAGTTLVLRPVSPGDRPTAQSGYGLVETVEASRFGKYRLAGERIWVDPDPRDRRRTDYPLEESPLIAVAVASINVTLWTEVSET